MKSMTWGLLAVALLPLAAQAAVTKPQAKPGQSASSEGMAGWAQVYYYPSAERERTRPGASAIDYSGDGFGGSFYIPFQMDTYSLYWMGDYSQIDYDEVTPVRNDDLIDELRLGIGINLNETFGAYLHYNDRKNGRTDNNAENSGSDGFAIHGTAKGQFQGEWSQFGWYGDVGYFQLESIQGLDIDGLEFWAGGTYDINPQYTAFADIRSSDFDVDPNAAGFEANIKYYDVRVGVRYNF